MEAMRLPDFIKGAVFDLDGTLLDSLRVWQDVDRRFFEKRGMPVPADFFDAILLLDLKDAAVYAKEHYGLPDPPEALVGEWLDMVRFEYAERVMLKPFAGEFVRKLHAEGYSLGVATSASADYFLPALERNGIAGCFTAFTESRETPYGKRSPDPYLLAAKKIGVPPAECAVFEDILQGVESAKRGGFYTVAVADPANSGAEKALRETADLFLPSYSELL